MRKMRILWVDDEVHFLKPFVLFLEKKGYEVITASNGSDAIDIVLNDKIDLVILDEMMPGLDGLSTLKEIKAINNSLPVVMVTKSEEEGLMDKVIASQIAEYLIKPINPNQIIMAIKKIFQADEIKHNKLGEDYSKFMSSVNQRLYSTPTFKDWYGIYDDFVAWDQKLDETNDPGLKQTHFLEKRNCNSEFANFVENNYRDWLQTDDRPQLSFDIVSEYVTPKLNGSRPTYLIILDCMRLDQFKVIEPYISKLFNVDLKTYFSILPTATPYSRNAIFSGLLPEDIASRFPEYWESSDLDNSRNRNEHQLLDELLTDLGHNINPTSKYIKIFNMEEGNFVLRKINSWQKEKLIVLVYNFLDLVAHHRSRDSILQETIPDEEALRAFTRHWFLHSSLYEAMKVMSQQKANVIITTDHGSIKVNRATQVIGDKDTTVTVRYKEGKNLTANPKHAMFEGIPHNMGLPRKNIVDNFIFAKDDYYFVYPNLFHQYQKQFNGTFQHGGISMEEMLLPVAICTPKD
ncbi:MAG: response regulator [Candidatus Zophobacter franzmannii]|nr:response regulator [Candidatus Zophobacter franzmannii]